MDNIKSLLEKEPKLKDDIKKIIVDQLVKAKMHPDQYEDIKNKIESLETPETIRKPRAKPKPRAKKESDIIESELPQGKIRKSNQKKKEKVIIL